MKNNIPKINEKCYEKCSKYLKLSQLLLTKEKQCFENIHCKMDPEEIKRKILTEYFGNNICQTSINNELSRLNDYILLRNEFLKVGYNYFDIFELCIEDCALRHF